MTITCPECGSEYGYQIPSLRDPGTAACPECGHEVRIKIANPDAVDEVDNAIDSAVDNSRKAIRDLNKGK